MGHEPTTLAPEHNLIPFLHLVCPRIMRTLLDFIVDIEIDKPDAHGPQRLHDDTVVAH